MRVIIELAMKTGSHIDSLRASKPQSSVRIIRIICFQLNAWCFFQDLFLLDLLELCSCTFTVATCISSIAFCINIFAHFLQPVATKGQHDQVKGNTAVEKFSFWSCVVGAFNQKEERAAKKKNTHFVLEYLPLQMGSGVSEPAGNPRILLLPLVELDAL